jgi:hypothetical protein
MTITLTREEAQQVLDAMQQAHGDYHMMPGRVGPKEAFAMMRSAIETLSARLSAPEPEEKKYTEESCPVCGYYCLGKGGVNCIDKPKLCGINTAPPQRERVQFPTMLRKMWSGTEVQAWLDENVNQENNND